MSVSPRPEGISFIKERSIDLMGKKKKCYVLKNDIVDFFVCLLIKPPLVFKDKAFTTVENYPLE